MRHYFISSFQPSQVLILHSYLLLAPVVCRSSVEKKEEEEKKKASPLLSHAVHIHSIIDFL